jgi:hypothetical protein
MSVLKDMFNKAQKHFQGTTPTDVLTLCKLKEEKPVNEKELLVFAILEVKNKSEVLRMTTMGFYRAESDKWINDHNGQEETFTHWMIASDLAKLST